MRKYMINKEVMVMHLIRQSLTSQNDSKCQKVKTMCSQLDASLNKDEWLKNK